MTPKTLGVALIRLYQKTLSLDHGPLRHVRRQPTCKFHPTCSEYGAQAIERFGLVRGSFLTVWRIMRCHPWSLGGIDPVPARGQTEH